MWFVTASERVAVAARICTLGGFDGLYLQMVPTEIRPKTLISRAERADITDGLRQIADLAKTQLKTDDMFLVGADRIGEKMVEVNVFSPGALHAAERVTGVDFMTPVIEALERRIAQAPGRSKTQLEARQPFEFMPSCFHPENR